MVVVCLRQVPCPRAEGGAHNSVGQRARTHNTIQALLRLEGSKASIPSFPGSTFPIGAQGMDSGIVVLTYEPCLAFLRTSSGSLRTGSPRSDGSNRPLVRRSEKSGEQASCEPRLWGRSRGVGAGSSAVGIPRARLSPSLGGRVRRSQSLSSRARQRLALSPRGEVELAQRHRARWNQTPVIRARNVATPLSV